MRRVILFGGLVLLCLVPVYGAMTDHSGALAGAVSTELPAMRY
ncbi:MULTISPECIES: hypothetical protein [Pseudooceanicola]|nr:MULTISPECIES: hypothetical protein [Pseudooceanicola]